MYRAQSSSVNARFAFPFCRYALAKYPRTRMHVGCECTLSKDISRSAWAAFNRTLLSFRSELICTKYIFINALRHTETGESILASPSFNLFLCIYCCVLCCRKISNCALRPFLQQYQRMKYAHHKTIFCVITSVCTFHRFL